MRILVANVNTTQSMTDSIAAQARSIAAPGTEIMGLTPSFGADSCEGNFESYLAAIAVMDRVVSYPEPFDAVIQAGYGEHGREGLQELLDVPVVDITEAAASTAMFLGHKYSVVTTLDRAVPLIEDRLKLAGLDARCASVQGERDGRPGARGGAGAGRRGHHRTGAARCPGRQGRGHRPGLRRHGRAGRGDPAAGRCSRGGRRGLGGDHRRRPGPDGLSTSKVRTYAAPRPKTVIGWPLSAAAAPSAAAPAVAEVAR